MGAFFPCVDPSWSPGPGSRASVLKLPEPPSIVNIIIGIIIAFIISPDEPQHTLSRSLTLLHTQPLDPTQPTALFQYTGGTVPPSLSYF